MLEEKIMNDFKEAMKARDSAKVATVSFLRAALSYAAIEKNKKSLDDAECIAVIRKLIKQHQESITQFTAGARKDLADKEAREVEFLKAYLPPEMPEDQIKSIIDEAIAATGAAGPKDMGKVMKEVAAKTAGRADGKTVSDMVKAKLSPPKV
ncbi:MAG: GatB/YqeY domain-containing protein [Candidatus Omnitrophica bacterium]|nr:GatB/YqeY domain-containing protein [Candidatus Omnitrophota bacterium]